MAYRTCSVEGCEVLHFARGWCMMHYYRWKRNGDPGITKRTATLWPEFERLILVETDDCVLWPHSLSSHGYGRVTDTDGLLRGVHALACEYHHGRCPLIHQCKPPITAAFGPA